MRRTRRHAAAFILAVGLLAFVGIVVTMVVPVVLRDAQLGRSARAIAMAFETAVAGTEAGIQKLTEDPKFTGKVEAPFGTGSYSVTVAQLADKTISLKSVGTVEGISRMVERVVRVSDDPVEKNPFTCSVFGAKESQLTDTVGSAGQVVNSKWGKAIHTNTLATLTNVAATGTVTQSGKGDDAMPVPDADLAKLASMKNKDFYASSDPISNDNESLYAGKIVYGSSDIRIDLSKPKSQASDPSQNTLNLPQTCLVSAGNIIVEGSPYQLVLTRQAKLPVMVAGGKVIFRSTASGPVSYIFGPPGSGFSTTVGTGVAQVTGTIFAKGGIEIDNIQLSGILVSAAHVTVTTNCDITYLGKGDYFTLMNEGLRVPAGRIVTVAWK